MEICISMVSAGESFKNFLILLTRKYDCCKHLKIISLKLSQRSVQRSNVYYASNQFLESSPYITNQLEDNKARHRLPDAIFNDNHICLIMLMCS